MGTEEAKVNHLPKPVQAQCSQLTRLKHTQSAFALARYFNDSTVWVTELRHVLKKSNGTGYIVLGENYTHGYRIDTPHAIQEIAKQAGLTAEVVMRYRLTNYHMQYPTRSSRIKSETILKVTP
jgi:hypothetical protein